MLASQAASLQRSYHWTASSRHEAVPRLTGRAGAGATGVQLYFGARVAYLALYAAGVLLLRSLLWNAATLGIALLLLSLV